MERSPATRIALALNRIEASVKRRNAAESAMVRRHDALKTQMAAAIDELDTLIARGDAA